ncbi:MAG: CPBP family intramembrane metalloprotease [Prevotellaceae bacterium]|jgi:membrane protease YdiL (CAAX protease family)|nr:CPBP family intramembrane metalloprotease [Prevotellaceae bacterium]
MQYLENVLGKDNSFWKYVTVILVTIIAIQFSGIFSETLSDLELSENFTFILKLFPFVVGMVTLWLLVGGMHKRSFSTTVNGSESVRWTHVISGFSFWFLLMLVFFAIRYIINPDNFTIQFDSSKFIPLLVITLFLIPIQTTFEEYMFRGYLAQGVAAWTKNRWLVIFIPGLLFGLAHYTNTEVAKYGFWMAIPQYIIFGLFFGLVAVLDDGIELPVGIHAAHNMFVCLFITNDASTLRTPSIFRCGEVSPLAEIVISLMATTVAVLFFYCKYKWKLNIINIKITNSNYAEQTV